VSAATLASRIDDFLASRGVRAGAPAPPAVPAPLSVSAPAAPATTSSGSESPAEFVCEEDVRAAVRTGRKILVGERTIITPSARDLGEAEKVFVPAGWRT